jgi:putative chitinase
MSYQIKNGNIVAKDTEGNTRKFPQANVDVVISECKRLGLSNKYLIAGILAVISKESGFVPVNENLNYSEKGLKGTFGSYFNPSRANAAEYAKKPEKIANYVYGGTWDGGKYKLGRYGNNLQGDGFKFRGRGFNQITFKAGYEKYQKLIPSVISNPDQLNNPKEAATANAEFFLNNFKNNDKTIRANYGKSAFDMSDWNQALKLCANANAGLGKGPNNEKVIWAYNNSKKCHGFLIDYLEKNPQGKDLPPDNPSNVNQPVDNTQPTPAEQENAAQGTNEQGNDPNNNNTNVNNGQPVTILTQFSKPTIAPTKIEFNLEGYSKKDKEKLYKQLGYLPFIYYNGIPIGYKDVKKVNLFHKGLLPAIELSFVDTWGIFREDAFPADDAVITIYLNSRSKNLRSIHMDFKIIDFKDNNDNSYYIVGVCNIPQIYLRKFNSYSGKTSIEALQEVAKQCELGFCSNIQNSDDKMTWINTGFMVKDFIESIIDNSYVSETSYQYLYIDFYYNICYVDIGKEMERDVSGDKMIASYGYKFLASDEDGENQEIDEQVVDMVLLNDKSVKDSPAYIENFELINKSTKVSINKAYRTRTKYYDVISKELLVFDVESQTSDGSKSIILKSRPGDDKFFKENTNSVYIGKQDIFNDGEGNVHKNYNYSVSQNRQNLDDITKLSAKMYLPNINFNLYIYQKIQIFFTPQKQTPSIQNAFYKRISGDWLITNLEFEYENGAYHQVVTAIKRELSLLPNEIDNAKRPNSANNDGNSANNVNQLSPNDTAPNDPTGLQQPSNVANTPNPDKGTSPESTDSPANDLTNPPGTNNKLLYISNYKGKSLKYIVDASTGVAGKRLKRLIGDLQSHLRANGYPQAEISSNGIMRDLNAAAYPDSPARAKGSFHGSGLAVDVKFKIPGKKWNGIGDNVNLSTDAQLTKTIWSFVVSQKDIKWGAEFGKSSPSAGLVKDRGITEYHHFELKKEYMKQYWENYSVELSKLGYNPKDLDNTTTLQKLYVKLLA